MWKRESSGGHIDRNDQLGGQSLEKKMPERVKGYSRKDDDRGEKGGEKCFPKC